MSSAVQRRPQGNGQTKVIGPPAPPIRPDPPTPPPGIRRPPRGNSDPDRPIGIKDGMPKVVNPPPSVTFEQAHQQVGYQYNAGGNINITNIQSPAQLPHELEKLVQEVTKAVEKQVISREVASKVEKQLNQISEQLQNSSPPPAAAIVKSLRATQDYLQTESVKLVQQAPSPQSGIGFFRWLVGVATLVAISFDLGITAGIVTGLFGLAARKS